MKDEKGQILKDFLKHITELYENIENWLDRKIFNIIHEDIELNEEACGVYKVSKLVVKNQEGITIADIVPVGAWVIGANGRVDLLGKYDSVIIVYFEKGGPSITTTISSGGHTTTSETRFYKGIEEAGWYWVEDRRRGKAHKINREMFYELLAEVSDYEFN